MDKQVIVSISREFCSGGHAIGEYIAKAMGLGLVDRNMLDEIAQRKNIRIEYLEKYDEKPRNLILSRRVGAFSNSIEDIIAEMQFEYLRDKASSGESFVVVGRCADSVLGSRKCLIPIFVMGAEEDKIAEACRRFGIGREEAVSKMRRHDRTRKQYHNRYSENKWGDSRYYDICINSSKLGIEKTAVLLTEYIRERMERF